MGISALQQKVPKESSFPLLKSIKYLGYFGLVHGITEWVVMIRLGNFLPAYNREILTLATLINALSFAFLWTFGVMLSEYKSRFHTLLKALPWISFSLWLVGFLFSYRYSNQNYFNWLFIEDTISRYFIGLPGGLMTAYALNKNAEKIMELKLKAIAIKLKGLSLFVAAYSIFAGVIVNESNFFPANIINKRLFYQVFHFPVELGRTITAVGITVLFISAIDIFRWETNQKIAILSREKLMSQERRKLGRELHDGIIQNLFATGLQIENLLEQEEDVEKQMNLISIKENLNDTITQVRGFIQKVSTQSITPEELKDKLSILIEGFTKTCDVAIEFHYNISDLTLGFLSQEKLTHIYYIVQEAISNAVKHAEASKLIITVDTDLKSVIARISDNGKGFDMIKPLENNRYGIISMQERAASVKGILLIHSNEKGTSISVSIPWEE